MNHFNVFKLKLFWAYSSQQLNVCGREVVRKALLLIETTLVCDVSIDFLVAYASVIQNW